jgi:hypothetical protein
MAEATDRSQGAGPVPSDTEERITTQADALASSGEELGAIAPMASETYRPLSLLALAGFGLAVLYALVVLIGAAVALFSRIPWLMPSWTFLLPLAALVLCWAARTRIRESEGTLSGLAFTTWGFRLTILVGLTYAAYYGATFFAVRGQAIDCADRFFEDIKQGRNEQAFLLSLGIPPKDMEGADLRNMLESRFNSPKGMLGSVGDFTRFCQAQFVRFIEMDGPKANIALKGVSEWEYSKGGYRVVLKYHIATSLVNFEMNLETFGRDSKPGEPKGRQWQIVLPKSDAQESMKLTPLGEEVVKKKLDTARQFVMAWTEKINQQQWAEAYLDTLPPSERSRLRQGQLVIRFLATAPVAGLASLGLYDAACHDFLVGPKNLGSGKLIRIDDKTFWAGKQQRDEIKQRVQKTFQPDAAGRLPFNLTLQQVMPLVRESDGRTTAFFDVILRYLDERAEKTQYIVEGKLVVTAKGSDADRSLSAWRVEAIDVESGRTPPTERQRSSRLPDR